MAFYKMDTSKKMNVFVQLKKGGFAMQVLENIWLFFQDQILGMKWMNVLIGNGLSAVGIDMESKVSGMLQFFIYDTIKIFILLSVLIFLISYIQSFFPPERSKKQ